MAIDPFPTTHLIPVAKVNEQIAILQLMQRRVHQNKFSQVQEDARVVLRVIEEEIDLMGHNNRNRSVMGYLVGNELSMRRILRFNTGVKIKTTSKEERLIQKPHNLRDQLELLQQRYLYECENSLERLRKMKRALTDKRKRLGRRVKIPLKSRRPSTIADAISKTTTIPSLKRVNDTVYEPRVLKGVAKTLVDSKLAKVSQKGLLGQLWDLLGRKKSKRKRAA
tara:strand:- start:8187 stop:8855 length:669 start_codon:yes stop_codon:yes gene_type:complete